MTPEETKYKSFGEMTKPDDKIAWLHRRHIEQVDSHNALVVENSRLSDQLEAAKLREAELTREIQLGKDLSRALRENKSPCGHPEYFAYTEDGGKTVHCLLCAKQECDAALNAFERFRNAAKRHAPLYLIDVEAGTSDPSATLAERDRRTANHMATSISLYLDRINQGAAYLVRREFGLEPKTEGVTKELMGTHDSPMDDFQMIMAIVVFIVAIVGAIYTYTLRHP